MTILVLTIGRLREHEHAMRERQLGVHLLELRVLALELLQPSQLRGIETTVFRLPVVERRFADAELAHELRDLHSGLGLFQHGDDLLFTKSGLLHKSSPVWKTLLPSGPGRQGVTITGGGGLPPGASGLIPEIERDGEDQK